MHLDITTTYGISTVELDRPRDTVSALLVLTHGAAGGVETPDLLAIRTAAVRAGIAVARVLQPYRVAGRRAPAAPAKQDADWADVVAAVRRRRGLGGVPLVVGGRSNGARVACRTAVTSGAVGVAALAFPLHPPGRPDVSRLDELASAGVPTLVVQGDRDPFGMPPPDPDREIVVIPGADHSLRRDPATVARAVVDFVLSRTGSPRPEPVAPDPAGPTPAPVVRSRSPRR